MRRLAGAAEGRWLEVDLGVVVAALQQLFHLLLGRLAWVGAGAGIGNRVLCDLGQSLEEYVLGDKALLDGVGVGAVVADAGCSDRRSCRADTG